MNESDQTQDKQYWRFKYEVTVTLIGQSLESKANKWTANIEDRIISGLPICAKFGFKY